MDLQKNTTKAKKPVYITVVRQMKGGGETMMDGFKEFDSAVNAKIAEGYQPYGSLLIDHCSTSCMDVVQPMLLASMEV